MKNGQNSLESKKYTCNSTFDMFLLIFLCFFVIFIVDKHLVIIIFEVISKNFTVFFLLEI